MATLQEEENLAVAARKEVDSLIQQKVNQLIMSGEVELAAQLLIEHARAKLPDGHPSRNPGKNGVLEGEQVSQLSAFEDGAAKTKDGIAFAHAIYSGGPASSGGENKPIGEQLDNLLVTINNMHLTISTFAKEIAENHSGLMPSFTRALLAAKREGGFLPALSEGSAELVEGAKTDDAEDKADSE